MKVNTKDFAIVCGLLSIAILSVFISVKSGFRNATARDPNDRRPLWKAFLRQVEPTQGRDACPSLSTNS